MGKKKSGNWGTDGGEQLTFAVSPCPHPRGALIYGEGQNEGKNLGEAGLGKNLIR